VAEQDWLHEWLLLKPGLSLGNQGALFLPRCPERCRSSRSEQVDEEKEARKAEQARLMLAGKSFLEDEDIFKGMTPQVGRATGGHARGPSFIMALSSCHRALHVPIYLYC